MLRWAICFLYFVSYSKANLCSQYQITTPTFTVYKPRGLEVSIPNDDGINLVIFYVNVNRELSESDADYTQYVVSQADGRWTFNHNSLKLTPGDIVYYKIYVQRYRRGYLHRGTPYTVTGWERVQQPARPFPQPEDDCYEFPAAATTTPPPTTNIPPTTRTSTISTVPTTPAINNAKPLDCALFSNTLLKVLSDTQKELENVKNNQEVILEMASVQPYRLRLSGLITALDTPKEIVESVLLEKLDTNVKIKNATKVGTTITFELFTFEQKLDIYKRAKKYLKNSKNIVISL